MMQCLQLILDHVEKHSLIQQPTGKNKRWKSFEKQDLIKNFTVQRYTENILFIGPTTFISIT